jgi:hypothetical protein
MAQILFARSMLSGKAEPQHYPDTAKRITDIGNVKSSPTPNPAPHKRGERTCQHLLWDATTLSLPPSLGTR